MTREEAIEVIKLAMAQVEWDYPMDYAAAFDMAIKALEQEPTTKNDLGVDCIDRAEVLKLMKDNWHTHNGDWAMQESMDDIRALPSVTPQEPILDKIYADIQRLRGCSCSCSDGIIDDVEDILDKYKAESEDT